MEKVVELKTWSLSDSGMDLLERAGLAALYMALRAADETGEDLSPLTWSQDDLKPDSVTVRWTGPAKPAFQKLMAWAWQVRDGVLYLPAVHGERERSQWWQRATMHNGIMGTFFQSSRVQPRLGIERRVVRLDEDKEITSDFFALDTPIKPHKDVSDLFENKGSNKGKLRDDVELSTWVQRGYAARYPSDGVGKSWKDKPWRGEGARALLLMLVPTVCFYFRLQGKGNNWAFVTPDVRDLEEFDASRRRMYLNPDLIDVASLGDAGLSFLVEYSTRSIRSSLHSGCRINVFGIASYFHNSNATRKAILDVSADSIPVRRYRLLHREMPNEYRPPRADPASVMSKGLNQATPRKARNTSAKKTSKSDAPAPAGSFALPAARGRIADNLVNRRSWYAGLFVPQIWDHDKLEWQRKKNPGKSIDRLWFEAISSQWSKLMKLIHEDDMWDTEAEKVFVEAFWEALDSLYKQEVDAVSRGGSATIDKRWERLEGELYRSLTRAKTRGLLRESLALVFARAGRQKQIGAHTPAIWRLMDHPDHWQKGRDLALLAMASHRTKKDRKPNFSEKGN